MTENKATDTCLNQGPQKAHQALFIGGLATPRAQAPKGPTQPIHYFF